MKHFLPLENFNPNRKVLRVKANRYRNEIAIESDLGQKIKLETKFLETEADLKTIEAEMDEL